MVGSPPRAWGRPVLREGWPDQLRFTPTCVGTAPTVPFRTCPVAVHPHVRGDGAILLHQLQEPSGSPPRAWGRPGHTHKVIAFLRFTPTCVGTACWLPSAASAAAVHPHVRGDGDGTCRTRSRCSRFTPTCVGTAAPAPHRVDKIAVHPHVRGDGPGLLSSHEGEDGSPPRAWGRQVPHGYCPAQHRFTPTCVGTASAKIWRTQHMRTVHPHVRGDGFGRIVRGVIFVGSPPRAWGRRSALKFRTTPFSGSPPRAWGRRLRNVYGSIIHPVHPHVRGDGRRLCEGQPAHFGSPPRAWGRLGLLSLLFPGHAAVHPHVRGDGVLHSREEAISIPVHPHVRGDGA